MLKVILLISLIALGQCVNIRFFNGASTAVAVSGNTAFPSTQPGSATAYTSFSGTETGALVIGGATFQSLSLTSLDYATLIYTTLANGTNVAIVIGDNATLSANQVGIRVVNAAGTALSFTSVPLSDFSSTQINATSNSNYVYLNQIPTSITFTVGSLPSFTVSPSLSFGSLYTVFVYGSTPTAVTVTDRSSTTTGVSATTATTAASGTTGVVAVITTNTGASINFTVTDGFYNSSTGSIRTANAAGSCYNAANVSVAACTCSAEIFPSSAGKINIDIPLNLSTVDVNGRVITSAFVFLSAGAMFSVDSGSLITATLIVNGSPLPTVLPTLSNGNITVLTNQSISLAGITLTSVAIRISTPVALPTTTTGYICVDDIEVSAVTSPSTTGAATTASASTTGSGSATTATGSASTASTAAVATSSASAVALTSAIVALAALL